MAYDPAAGERYPNPDEESRETELYPTEDGNETGFGQEDQVEPDLQAAPDTEVSDEAAPGLWEQRQRAAMRAGKSLKCYVRPPGKNDPAHNGRARPEKPKSKKARDRDNDRHRGGGGREWWRRKVQEAKETHGDTCRCMFCMSPVII